MIERIGKFDSNGARVVRGCGAYEVYQLGEDEYKMFAEENGKSVGIPLRGEKMDILSDAHFIYKMRFAPDAVRVNQ